MEKIIILFIFFQFKPDLPSIYKKEDEEKRREGIFEKFSLKLIKIYQGTISSLQGEVCNFEPSCSRFMEQSIKRFGFVKGILLGLDRLQRCHRFSFYYYPKYYGLKNKKLYDPPEKYK